MKMLICLLGLSLLAACSTTSGSGNWNPPANLCASDPAFPGCVKQ